MEQFIHLRDSIIQNDIVYKPICVPDVTRVPQGLCKLITGMNWHLSITLLQKN